MSASEPFWPDDNDEPSDSGDSPAATGNLIPCPMCGRSISRLARVCPGCGERMGRDPEQPLTTLQTEKLKRFRRETHGLAGFWIIFGAINLGLGLALLLTDDKVGMFGQLDRGGRAFVGIFSTVVGGLWFISGIGAAYKQMSWVLTGLIVSYCILLLNVINFGPQSLCPVIIVGAVIIQAHRVQKFAKELEARDIELTRKPS